MMPLDFQQRLYDACGNRNVEQARESIANGALVNEFHSWTGRTPLHRAATEGCLDLMELLLTAGADVNARELGRGQNSTIGWTPLMNSLLHPSAVKFLLDYGADPDIANQAGDTALHLACCLNNPESVMVLLHAGAARHQANGQGETPLQLAERYDRHDTISRWKAFESAEAAQQILDQDISMSSLKSI